MKNLSVLLFCILLSAVYLQSCTGAGKQQANDSVDLVKENASFASEQYGLMIIMLEDSGKRFDPQKVLNPRTYVNGKTEFIPPQDWTSGFFPGSLWYLYELTGDDRWKATAIKYTEALDTVKYYTGNHDVGFMIGCSYGNALRLTGNSDYRNVIIQAAKSLATRYNPTVGLIQSWDTWNPAWEYPVIIDNMMNLELLFDATELSGDSTFYYIAVSHADNTMENHFRPDYSTWHVIDYTTKDGSVRQCNTFQGYSDESCWSRGQAWAVYGYTMCYRKTGDANYLDQAVKAATFFADHPNYPDDGIPFWDFNDPDIPHTYRDASAAAVLASALYELSTYSQKQDYKAWADKIITSLSGTDYRAPIGENGYFLLLHSVGSLPHNAEVDVPLNYADYYFLEALKRKNESISVLSPGKQTN